jgi:hypothetical protein
MELVIVGFLIDVPPAFGFYANGFSLNSSQLISQVIRIHTRLGHSSSGHHVNWLRSKRKLWQGLIIKAAILRLAVSVVPRHIVVGMVRQESR